MSGEEPISYLALAVGTPVLSSSAKQIGTVEHVLQIPELDLFDGIVVETAAGSASSTATRSIGSPRQRSTAG